MTMCVFAAMKGYKPNQELNCILVPIREVISVVLPHLCRHEYCQPEHINPDKYKYDTGRIRYHSKERTEMIAIRPRNQNDYIHIPYSVYKQIKEEDL